MTPTLQSRAGDALRWQALQVVGVKAVHFLRLVILARILVPEDFGLVAISTVAVAFLLAATNPGMLPALVQKAEPGSRDYDAAWSVGMLRALLVAGPLIIAAPWIADLFQEPRATALIRVLALQPILQAAASIQVAGLMRELHFRQLTGIQVSEAVTNAVVSIALAPAVGVWALVWGPLAGSAVGAAVSYVVAPHRPRPTLEGAVVRPLILYGRWIFLAGMLGVGTGLVLQMAISRTLGAAELGLYFLAVKLAYLAWDATSALVDKVSFPVYARLQRSPDEARQTFQFILTALAVFLVPASVVLIVVAPGLVETVLGSRWEGTVPIIRILAAAVVVGLLGDCIVPMLLGFGRPWGQAILEGIQFLFVAILVWPFLNMFGVAGAAWTVLLATAMSQPLGAALAKRALLHPFSGLLPALGVVTLAALAAAAAAGLVQMAVPGLLGVSGAIFASVVVVGLLLRYLDARAELDLGNGLRRFFPRAAPILNRILPPPT